MFDPSDPKPKMSFGQPISLYRKIAFTFLGLTLAVILVILYFSTANATIKITSSVTSFPVDFIETVKQTGTDEVALGEDGAKYKGRIFEAVKDGSKEFGASVVAEGEPTKATGSVTIYNISSRPQPLVKTTRLLSKDGVLFRLVEGVTVPAQVKGEAVPAQIEAKVAADEPGKQGEIGPSEFTIPGLNPARQKEVYARSTAAMTGGTRAVRLVTDADLKKAEDELANDLAVSARVEWETQLPADLKVLGRSVLKEVLESKADAKAGDKVEKFTVTLKVRVAGLALSDKELLRLASDRLRRALSADQELVTPDESSLNYSPEKFDSASKALTLKITLTGQTRLRSTSPVFDKSKLAGRPVEEAVRYLKTLPGVADVKIQLSPFWVRGIPRLKDHIRIIVDQ